MATTCLLPDVEGVLGDDLDRAVVLDGHHAAAHGLPVGEVDEDVVAWSPTRFWFIHAARMRAEPGQVYARLFCVDGHPHVGRRLLAGITGLRRMHDLASGAGPDPVTDHGQAVALGAQRSSDVEKAGPVRASVVSAEQEISGRQHRPDLSGRRATVTALGRGRR